MAQRQFLAAMLVAMMLALLIAACGGDDDDAPDSASSDAAAETTRPAEATPTDEAAEPTATSQPDEPTATIEAEEPTATAEPESDDRLMGSASVEDDEDDVVNLLMQEPDEPMPGIDLVHVQLEGDGEQLIATIQTAGDIAGQLSDDPEVSFDVHLWQDDKPAYALSFHYEGAGEWEATVTDFLAGLLGDEETVDTEITLDGNTLSSSFPVDLLPDLDNEFEWYASVMLSDNGMPLSPDAWFDGAPENVIQLLADPDEFVAFPQNPR